MEERRGPGMLRRPGRRRMCRRVRSKRIHGRRMRIVVRWDSKLFRISEISMFFGSLFDVDVNFRKGNLMRSKQSGSRG
jgi:hypothetical protein